MPRILLVDDDRLTLRSLEKLLAAEGYYCRSVVSAAEARLALQGDPFDMVMLDVILPDQDGFTLCRQIRARHRMPIVYLTARGENADKVIGLEVGADNYLTKPFEPRELVARVRAHLRRATEYSQPVNSPNLIRIGTLIVDADKRDALCSGTEAHLTDREFELLHLLARHRDKALASDWLFENIWGYETLIGIKTLAVYIRRLRCKIEADPEDPCFLMTVRGFGYKLTSGSGTN